MAEFYYGAIPAVVKLVAARQRPGMVVAEIGCYDGATAQQWLKIVQSQYGKGFLVDNFLGNPGVVEGNEHGAASYQPQAVRARLQERLRPFANITVTVLDGDSAAMAKEVPDGVLDVCFIDADHRYTPFCRDLDAWQPKVRKGGILCGHDCEGLFWDERFIEMDIEQGNHHGVAKAVMQRFPTVKLVGDAVWAVEL